MSRHGTDISGRVDWSPLGDMDFDSIEALWTFASAGRDLASASSLIVAQARHDLYRACVAIPVFDGRPNAKARRVARPLSRAALHLHAVQQCMAVVPRLFVKVYGEEISAVRRQGAKQGIDLGKGKAT